MRFYAKSSLLLPRHRRMKPMLPQQRRLLRRLQILTHHLGVSKQQLVTMVVVGGGRRWGRSRAGGDRSRGTSTRGHAAHYRQLAPLQTPHGSGQQPPHSWGRQDLRHQARGGPHASPPNKSLEYTLPITSSSSAVTRLATITSACALNVAKSFTTRER